MSAPLHTQIPARLTKASASPAMQPLLYVLGCYMYRVSQITRHPSCSSWPFQNENGQLSLSGRNGGWESSHFSTFDYFLIVKSPRVSSNLRNPVAEPRMRARARYTVCSFSYSRLLLLREFIFCRFAPPVSGESA